MVLLAPGNAARDQVWTRPTSILLSTPWKETLCPLTPAASGLATVSLPQATEATKATEAAEAAEATEATEEQLKQQLKQQPKQLKFAFEFSSTRVRVG